MDFDNTFACPHCDRRYGYKPELEGKRIRCKCGEKFTVEAPLVEDPDPYDIDTDAPEDDGPDWSALLSPSGDPATPAGAPGRACPACGASVKPDAVLCIQCGTDVRSGKTLGTTQVAQDFNETHPTAASAVRTKLAGAGLLIHGLGYLAMMLGVALSIAGTWQAAQQNPLGDTLLEVSGIIMLIGLPLLVLGPFLCLAVPKDAGLFYLIGAIVLFILSAASIVAMSMELIPDYLANLALLPHVFAAGCFVAFMRQLAEYINAGAVYENTEFLLKTWKYIAITSILLVLPCISCFALVIWLVAQFIFTLSYGWIVCQAGIAAVKS